MVLESCCGNVSRGGGVAHGYVSFVCRLVLVLALKGKISAFMFCVNL